MPTEADELEVPVAGLGRTGSLRVPPGRVVGGVVALHGAAYPDRHQPLFEHLASTLLPLGIAVLSYDRRPAAPGEDVPLDDQAADAETALQWLRERYDAPVALFGFSQGAWAACLTAASSPLVAAAALVGCSGVSPARQMRFHTDELLRRRGFDAESRDRLRGLRLAMEELLRGRGDRAGTGALLAAATGEPWFPMAYLPPELPPEHVRWDDMDFDPAPVIERVGCPTLLVFGSDEDTVPVAESIETWRAHGDRPLEVVELPGCGHAPTTSRDAGFRVDDLHPDYTAALRTFYAGAFGRAVPAGG